MNPRRAVVLGILLLTLASWFGIPGHTWLQQDTQIYVPILEHLRDPGILAKDIVVERPHVSFTLYDEIALVLNGATGQSFKNILQALQFLTRALGFWGVFLIARSLQLSRVQAGIVTVFFSLGATIAGPAVLTVELEPTPRAFALPLLFLAIGFGANAKWLWSGIALGAATLLHPPTVWPLLPFYLVSRESRRALLPFLTALAILLLSAKLQTGVTESQSFFSALTPKLEMLQRMRATYTWIDFWWRDYLFQYLLLAGFAYLAAWKLWTRIPTPLRPFIFGLPVIGLLTMPLSWLLQNQLKWALMPQLQPMRAMLFITAMASILGVSAALYKRNLAWLLVPCLIPIQSLPPNLHKPDLAALSQWAKTSTEKSAVFYFADNTKANYPGIFRAEALRAIYVDWKGGGQVNYLPQFADEWWSRWQSAASTPPAQLEIDYLVINANHNNPGATQVFHNSTYAVYKIK